MSQKFQDDAARKQREAQRDLDRVHDAKRDAALRDPNRDTSSEVADRARREWKRGA